jgi:hypothetical protein
VARLLSFDISLLILRAGLAPVQPHSDDFDEARDPGNKNQGNNDDAEIVLDDRDAAEEIARRNKQENPERAANDIEEQKAFVRHAADAGHERRECSYDRQKSRNDDRLAAMFLVKPVCTYQIFFFQKPSLFLVEHLWADEVADPVVHCVSEYCRQYEKHNRCGEIESVYRGERSNREKKGIARQKGSHDKSRFTKYDNEEYRIYPRAVRRAQIKQVLVDVKNHFDEILDQIHEELLWRDGIDNFQLPIVNL